MSTVGFDLTGLEGLIVILFILGIALAVIEMVMPGIGVAGIFGVLSLVAGTILAAQIVSPAVLVLIIAGVLTIIAAMLFWLYKSAVKGGKVSKLLMLDTKTCKEEGYTSNPDEENLVGLEGTAATVLRPTGTGDFEGRKLDVVTEGEFLPKGTPIRIIRVEGFRVIVKKIENKTVD